MRLPNPRTPSARLGCSVPPWRGNRQGNEGKSPNFAAALPAPRREGKRQLRRRFSNFVIKREPSPSPPANLSEAERCLLSRENKGRFGPELENQS